MIVVKVRVTGLQFGLGLWFSVCCDGVSRLSKRTDNIRMAQTPHRHHVSPDFIERY